MAFGTYKEVVSARATDKAIQKVAQDGGIVSALLCYALEENIIDERKTPCYNETKTERRNLP